MARSSRSGWAETRRFVLIVIYAHIFMVYPGAPYNARYYVAILPLATMYVVRAFRELSWAAPRR